MSGDGTVVRDGLQILTEREKDTLRRLIAGHDAKSIARDIGLSVHTVNERLRDARRKLGVSSSREAARLLAGSESADPEILVDKRLGVSTAVDATSDHRRKTRWPMDGHRLAWFGGGMLIMSLIIAAIVFSSMSQSGAPPSAQAPASTMSIDPSRSAGIGPARTWIALIDGQRWSESWRTSAGTFRAQVSEPQWATMLRAVRQPLGVASERTFLNVTKATSLPNAPVGEYEVIQFRTNFAQRPDAAETVILTREVDGWKVAGYFIK